MHVSEYDIARSISEILRGASDPGVDGSPETVIQYDTVFEGGSQFHVITTTWNHNGTEMRKVFRVTVERPN